MSNDIKNLIHSTEEKSEFIQHKIVRDIKTKLYQGYTNNEITPLSRERLTSGVALRWEDIFGYADREELTMAQGKSLIHGQKYKSKELLKKWVKFYFMWKWGRIYKNYIQNIAQHSKNRSNLNLTGLRNQIQKVRWAELLQRSNELLAIDNKYQQYFADCSKRAFFKPDIEAQREIIIEKSMINEVDKDFRIFCDSEKQRLNKQLSETNKKVKFNIGTGYGYNNQLGSNGRQFGEVRAVVEMEIALDTASLPESKSEHCDFEIRQLELEEKFKKNSIPGSIKLFDKNLSNILQMNQLLASKDVWNNFSDSEGISLMQEYILSIEHLVDLDYELSSESLASDLVEKL